MLPVHWLTSIGVLLPFGIAGAYLLARDTDERRGQWIPALAVVTACLGYVAAEVVLPFNRLRIDSELKLSFLMLLGLVPAAAHSASMVPPGRGIVVGIAAGVLIALGLPSLIHDTVWHSCRSKSCVEHAARSTTIPYADWNALQWIRHKTDVRAVFQQSPQPDFQAGGHDVWIPVFAGRAVRASRRASRFSQESVREMARLFDPTDSTMPSRRASAHGIDYLYVSQFLDGRNFVALHARYSSDKGLKLAYAADGVEIWRIQARARHGQTP
jgi:hypothetical protein